MEIISSSPNEFAAVVGESITPSDGKAANQHDSLDRLETTEDTGAEGVPEDEPKIKPQNSHDGLDVKEGDDKVSLHVDVGETGSNTLVGVESSSLDAEGDARKIVVSEGKDGNEAVASATDGDTDATALSLEGDVAAYVKSTDMKSPVQGSKMKFEVVNSDGKFALKVSNASQKEVKQSESSKSATTCPSSPEKKKVREKTKPRTTKSADKSNPQRSKAADKPVGGKQRNKVRSPRSPVPDQPQPAQQKPLMDLRHILKKHEKQKEPAQIPAQQQPQVDFYGSMSAIPFLKVNKPKEKKRIDEEKQVPKQKRASTIPGDPANGAQLSQPPKMDDASSDEIQAEKPRLPTREEIIMEPRQYDEDQLQLWKSMSAIDNSLDSVDRPQELLPLRPGMRQQKKKAALPDSAVRAYSRPEDWINRPASISPQKRTYRVSMTKKELEDQILVMEPEDSVEGT